LKEWLGIKWSVLILLGPGQVAGLRRWGMAWLPDTWR